MDESDQAAADQTPEKTASEAPDYTKGFALFAQYGLPDTSKADYIKLETEQTRFGSEEQSWDDIARQMQLTGNAWLLKENGTVTLIENNAQVVAFKPCGWSKADLAADAKKVLADLADKNKARRFQGGSGMAGHLLLWTVHLANHGMRKEANEIAGRLFEIEGSPQPVIAQAVNALADAQYGEALRRLMDSKNGWANFEKDITTVADRFGADWKMSVGIKRLSRMVKKRVASSQAPAIQAGDLNDEDRKLAAELAGADPSYNRSFQNPSWIMTSEGGDSSVIGRIKARGIKSIPLLIALLNDEWPTLISRASLSTRYSQWSDSNDSEEEQANKRFERMARPTTRGEIAAWLLEAALPRGDERRGPPEKLSPEKLAENARKLFALGNAKSQSQLALLYMRDGDYSQRPYALHLLMQEKTEENLAAAEDYFLEVAVRHYDADSLRELVKARGPKGGEFLEKYRKAIEEDSDNSDEGYRNRLVAEIKGLEDSMGKSAKQILDEVTAGKRKWKDAKQAFCEALKAEEPDAAVGLLLDMTLGAKDATTKWEYLTLIPSVRQQGGSGLAFWKSAKPAPALDAKLHADKWRMLLDDKTSLEQVGGGLDSTVGSIAAIMVEMVYAEAVGPVHPQLNYCNAALGTKMSGVLRARAEARFSGSSELPKLPTASEVPAEREKAIKEQLAAASEDQLPPILAGLSLSEIIALDQNPDPEFIAKLLPSAMRIAKIRADGVDPATAAKLEQWKGKLLTGEAVEMVISSAREILKSGKNVRGAISREAGGTGVVIAIIADQTAPPEARYLRPGMFMAQLQSRTETARRIWEESPNNPNGARVQRPDFEVKNYEAKLDKFLKGELGLFTCGTLSFVGNASKKTVEKQGNPEPEGIE